MQEWDSCNRRPLILELAKHTPEADFVCINRPAELLIAPFKHPYRILETIDKEKRFVHAEQNVSIIRPFFLIHDQLANHIANQINGWLLRNQLKSQGIEFERYDRIIHWIYEALFYQIAKRVETNADLIFELYDEIDLTPWDGLQRKTIADEPPILKKSGLIFTLTDYIAQKRQKYAEKIRVIGNGVDYALFSKAASSEETPEDIKTISSPIIGLFGNIRNWIDFKMLGEIINSRPDWSFVVIGPVERDAKVKLDAIDAPNLHVLGKKKQEDLYKYLTHVNVGIIPYLQSEFIKESRPLKMLEYLAAGVPVVTVPVDYGKLIEIEGAVYIAKSSLEFINKIENALKIGKESKAICQSIARENTWHNVALKVLDACKMKWGIEYEL
jgi:glycosyltransferase involved in cell wall biosynthesis